MVINSDDMVRRVYQDPEVKHTLKQWWGPMVFDPNGEIDRSAVARKVFNIPSERTRLERLVHPIVNRQREQLMNAAAQDPAIKAYVWDTPLLFETELNKLCDAVVFVEAPAADRLKRVQARGWDSGELARRENSQMPLDSKARISDYSLVNAAGPEGVDSVQIVRDQVRKILSQILGRHVGRLI